MSSIIPISTSYDLTHMYLPKMKKIKTSDNLQMTLFDIINYNSDFKKFKYILELSGMSNKYSDQNSKFTLFVPSDLAISNIPDDIFMNMSPSHAKSIIKTSTLPNVISSELLEESPSRYFLTTHHENKLLITNNNNKTIINENINIIDKDKISSNGIIHTIDWILFSYNI